MESSREHNFFFCELCGTMLSFTSTKYVECPLCKFKKDIKEISGKELRYSVTAKDIRRELKILPFVREDRVFFAEGQELTKEKIKRECENCGHNEMEFKSLQLRSADEGQTTIYTCIKCRHTFREG